MPRRPNPNPKKRISLPNGRFAWMTQEEHRAWLAADATGEAPPPAVADLLANAETETEVPADPRLLHAEEEIARLRKELAAEQGKKAHAGATTLNGERAEWPKVFYNAHVVDERFLAKLPDHPGQMTHFARFARGRYLAHNAEQEKAVRAALRVGYGVDKPDRWYGEDLDVPQRCDKCEFETFNRRAAADHIRYHPEHRFQPPPDA